MSPVETKIAEKARTDAKRDFAEHRLLPDGVGRWYVGKEGSGNYSFRVITGPSLILLFGDVGELLLLPSDHDALAWLRGVMKPGSGCNVDYVASKIPPDFRQREFNRERAAEHMADADAKTRRAVHEALQDADDGDETHAFETAWHEASDDCEVPDPTTYTWRTYYQIEALRKFAELLEETKP